jgi:plasmid stabilization system protein ParE
MTYNIIIKEEAYHDLQAAYDYYEEQRAGLGDNFVEKIKERINYLKKYPLHFTTVEKEFRQTLIDRFPYLIIYELSGAEIIIYAFFHCSRNPKKKFKV